MSPSGHAGSLVPAPAEFTLPDYGGPSLRAVLPAVAEALGAPLAASSGDDAGDDAGCGVGRAEPPGGVRLEPTDKVCVVLVDGLGMRMLEERGGHAPFLRSLLPGARALSAGFPSTTATSLTMLGTALHPGVSGMLGYTLRDPRSRELTNMLSWGGSARPEEWQPCPTVFERLSAAGVEIVSIGKERFRDSGLSRAAFRGGSFSAGGSMADRVDVALRALRRGPARLVYLYWGDVDTAGHHKGWGSWEWGEQVESVDRELARLARSLPTGTTLLVTADHGMVDVGHKDKIDVAKTPDLARGVDLVAGEPRASHVYCAAGQADDVALRWQDVLGETAWVLTRAQAEGLGLFGPVLARHRAAIGDVVVAARGRRAVLDSRTQTPQSLGLVGMHGSLTRDEMVVPLVVVTR